MKRTLLAICLLVSSACMGQEKVNPTTEFTIGGKVKTELKVTLADLGQYETRNVPDMAITNHLGELKRTAKGLKGILLKDILGKTDIQAENPKVLSEFFIACIASDGYKIVFSWNELFNTATGNNVYVIVEMDGIKIGEMKDRILLVSTTDFKTGRRFLKSLQKINIQRVD